MKQWSFLLRYILILCKVLAYCSLFIILPSTLLPVFMDGSLIFILPSMFLPVFMDGSQIFILSSMFLPIFMDGTRAFVHGTGGFGLQFRLSVRYPIAKQCVVSLARVVWPYFTEGFGDFLCGYNVLLFA